MRAMTSSTFNGVAKLSDLGVIRVEGEDAAKFLHGQLTQDFVLLKQDQARLAAFCNAKGRMQASFIGFKRSPSEVLLLCKSDILGATLKRLSQFVLRAKARLSDASADFSIFGLAGSACLDAMKTRAIGASSVWSKSDFDHGNWVQLYPADGSPRALCIESATTQPDLTETMSLQDWNWGDVRSGVAWVSKPVVEAFVPQMLNYESVGGVNFKKGCYPGQEVVARSQFRGTLKRRAYLAHCNATLVAGSELFDDEQACGMVAQAALSPNGRWDAVVVMQTTALAAGSLHIDGVNGPAVTLEPPPYPLLDDI